MNNSMISAMVAMSGIQQKLGLVSDNIANADTVGYKGKQATFEDVFTAVKQQPGAASALSGRVTASGYNLGFGARMSDVTMNTAQGEMQTTNNPNDLAIEGDGMFAVSADGKQGWTREGSFHFVPSATDPTKAFMATDQGYLLMGKNARGVSAPLEVPAKTNIQIDDKGIVRSTDGAGKITVLPQTVQVDRVIHPEGLTQMDGNLFMLPTGANLNDVIGAKSATTQIRQGFLEGSNVDLSAEMSELITVQRAYQLAARTLSSSDNMMSITNSIRG